MLKSFYKLYFLLIYITKFLQNVSLILFPQQNEYRIVNTLDKLWTFVAEPSNSNGIGFKNNWSSINLFSFENATVMPVPSSFNDLTVNKFLKDHVGWVWYQTFYWVHNNYLPKCKIINFQEECQSEYTTKIYFESVNYAAYVFINGKKIGYHIGGHLPFEFIIDVYKIEQPLLITVAVNNTLSLETIPPGTISSWYSKTKKKYLTFQTPNFDFFHYAGILRSVHIVHYSINHITNISLTPKIIDNDTGVLNYCFNANLNINLKKYGYSYRVAIRLVNNKTKIFNDVVKTSGKIFINNLQKWNPIGLGKPNLYIIKIELLLINKNNVSVVDLYRETFGFRTITVNENSILINNKTFYCCGFGMHEESDIRGRSFDRVLMTKDLNLLEWMNGNCYRTSHYPYSEERAREADRRGIAVITETPAVGMSYFTEKNRILHQKMLTEMIERDYNRPSVIMWSIANEAKTDLIDAKEYFRSLINYAKKIDSFRPITMALNTDSLKDQVAQFLDVICINKYVGWYENLGKLEEINETLIEKILLWKKNFKKPLLISEYGVEAIIGLSENPGRPFSEQYQLDVLRETYKAFDFLRKKKKLAGEMIWNFADFMTDNSITRVSGNHKGVFTRNRNPKQSAYFLRIRYKKIISKKEKI